MSNVRVVLFVLAAAIVVAAIAPESGQAAVTVGSSLRERANLFTRCETTCTELQTSRPGGLVAATIPSDGILVRWRLRAATRGWARLRILRPQADGSLLAVDGSDLVQLTRSHAPGDDARYDFPASIPVREGDLIALDRDHAAGAVFHGYGADASYAVATFSPVLGDAPAMAPPSVGGRELLLNADVERDADGDGLGDESQDPCPSVPASTPSVPCPVARPAPTPTTTTPGYEGPTVEGEGGPTRPTGRDPVSNGSRPAPRPTPSAPARRTSRRQSAGRPTRAQPPRQTPDRTRDNAGTRSPRRQQPSSQARQRPRHPDATRKRRADPPSARAKAPERQSGATPQRAEPAKPTTDKPRRKDGRAPRRGDPPPAPAKPTFEPH